MTDPIDTAREFELAETVAESCVNPDCVRSKNHHGECADAEAFKRALEAVDVDG